MLKNISNMICDGSSIVFDYPNYEELNNVLINEMLASGQEKRCNLNILIMSQKKNY